VLIYAIIALFLPIVAILCDKKDYKFIQEEEVDVQSQYIYQMAKQLDRPYEEIIYKKNQIKQY